MIGILEELDFGKVTWQNVTGIATRLGRIQEDIDRTLQEIKSSRSISRSTVPWSLWMNFADFYSRFKAFHLAQSAARVREITGLVAR